MSCNRGVCRKTEVKMNKVEFCFLLAWESSPLHFLLGFFVLMDAWFVWSKKVKAKWNPYLLTEPCLTEFYQSKGNFSG